MRLTLWPVRILLWHGYLLTGSGSNLYTANIAKVWRARGHDVLVMCQERGVDELDFVDEHGDFDAGNARVTFAPGGASPGPGRCRVARPAIGSILPVYVFDEYEGFQAKRFIDLTDDELDHYTASNVTALKSAISDFDPDAIITGHEVMGPYIAKVACESAGRTYLAKLHGSALEYAVKLQDRYRRFATEGLGAARVVAGGSRYMLEEAASVVPGWRDRGVVVNPGCDVSLFRPIERSAPPRPTVGYVGKLIASKGVHNFLAALGATNTGDMEAVVVGYGGFERALHELWDAIAASDASRIRSIASEGEDGRPLADLLRFVDSIGSGDGYFERARSVQVEWPGRLDHGPLARVLPTFDALVVPSVVPEAFGMVGAEAAACGVLPIVPAHSGIGEVGAAVEAVLERPGFLTFDPADPVRGIAGAISRVLSVPFAERVGMGRRACEFARQQWSWETVADTLLGHASAR